MFSVKLSAGIFYCPCTHHLYLEMPNFPALHYLLISGGEFVPVCKRLRFLSGRQGPVTPSIAPLMTPTTPLQTSFTVTLSPASTTPAHPGSYTIPSLPNCLFRPLSSLLFGKTSHHVPVLKRSTGA